VTSRVELFLPIAGGGDLMLLNCHHSTARNRALSEPEDAGHGHRAHQLYKNISMLFLIPVKDSKLSTGVNATFNASCYG